MSEYDDDEFEGNEESGPKALRDQVKKLNAKIAELTTENTTLKSATTVAAVLAAKGLPAKLANLYSGEPDEASVDAWATEYADVFGLKPAADEAADEGADEEVQEQYAAMNRAQSTGVPSAAGEAALTQKIESIDSPEALMALIAKGG